MKNSMGKSDKPMVDRLTLDPYAGFTTRRQMMKELNPLNPFRDGDEEAFNRLRDLADVVGVDLLIHICKAVCEARAKHEDFAEDFKEGYQIVESEFYEFKAQALCVQKKDGALRPAKLARAEEEMMHAIAAGIRLLRREYQTP